MPNVIIYKSFESDKQVFIEIPKPLDDGNCTAACPCAVIDEKGNDKRCTQDWNEIPENNRMKPGKQCPWYQPKDS